MRAPLIVALFTCTACTACTKEAPIVRSEPASCCVGSASVKVPTAAANTPEECWSRLLAAMRGGDEEAMKRYTTPAGFASLERLIRDQKSEADRGRELARIGKAWGEMETRWKSRDGERAHAVMGPQIKEHGLDFVLIDGAWKLDRWTPGE